MRTIRSARVRVLVVALSLAAGCSAESLDIANTNSPTEQQLVDQPTRSVLALAARGVAAGVLNDVGTEIPLMAVLGREGWNLQGNDPRFTLESLRGPLNANAFGGLAWLGKYQALRTINVYLAGIRQASDLSAAEVSASSGFAKTLKAVLLHRLITRSGATGIPIDVDRGLTEDPAPFVSQAGVYARIVALLDEANAELLAAGTVGFPFPMAPGYAGFESPATFSRFNRGYAAKVQVHRATLAAGGATAYQAALTAMGSSFISEAPADLARGVYYSYSTAAGEPANPISEALTATRHYVHPSIGTLAQLKADGQRDDRYTAKVRTGASKTVNDLTGTLKPILYNINTPTTSVADLGADIPLLKNEELLLLRAEARWFTGDKTGALADLNRVRTGAGGLQPTSLTTASADAAFVGELVYNRLMSLLWEQGTRWIDARRFNLLNTLPLDRPGDQVFQNLLVPASECDARNLPAPCNPPTT
jgi:hypothetical protein